MCYVSISFLPEHFIAASKEETRPYDSENTNYNSH